MKSRSTQGFTEPLPVLRGARSFSLPLFFFLFPTTQQIPKQLSAAPALTSSASPNNYNYRNIFNIMACCGLFRASISDFIRNLFNKEPAEVPKRYSYAEAGWQSDEEILAAHRLLSSREGIFVEPASAASVAGLLKMHAAGRVPSGATIVCTVTGHGLKDPQWALRNADGPTSSRSGSRSTS